MLVVLLGAAVVGGCAKEDAGQVFRDPRAYEVDSGDLSLEEALRRAGLGVPACMQDDLRYALIDNGLGYYYKIYMRLESSVSCMDSFLVANGMRDVFQAIRTGGIAAETPLLQRELWMDDEVVEQMGWDLGPEQRFQKFQMGNYKHYSMDALVQHVPGTQRLRVFVYAFHGG